MIDVLFIKPSLFTVHSRLPPHPPSSDMNTSKAVCKYPAYLVGNIRVELFDVNGARGGVVFEDVMQLPVAVGFKNFLVDM